MNVEKLLEIIGLADKVIELVDVPSPVSEEAKHKKWLESGMAISEYRNARAELSEYLQRAKIPRWLCGATDGNSEYALRHYCTLEPGHGGTHHEHRHRLFEPGCAYSSWPIKKTDVDSNEFWKRVREASESMQCVLDGKLPRHE